MARPTKEERAKKALENKAKSTDTNVTNTNNNSNSEEIVNEINLKELEQEMDNDVKIQSGLSESNTNNGNNSNIEDVEFENIDENNIDSNNNVTQHEKFEMPEDEDDLADLGANENSNNLSDIDDDIPDMDFDPLKERVKERDYTRTGSSKDNTAPNVNGTETNPNGTPQVEAEEAFIPEPEIKEIPLEDDVIDDISGSLNKGKGGNNSGGGNNNNGGSNNNNGGGNKNTGNGGGNNNNNGGSNNNSGGEKKENPNPKLDDLSPAQKRKAAEKTADALILTYAQIVPIPFKKISSFNMRKLQQMDMKDELKLKNVIDDDGTTIKEYCEGVNEQVDKTFVITKEMQNEIKEPLVDVLLENNLALTPTQRLLMAVGGQVLQMGLVAVQHLQQNKGAMEYFKEFHKENLAEMKKMNETKQSAPNTNTNDDKNQNQKVNNNNNNNNSNSNNNNQTNNKNNSTTKTNTSNVNTNTVKEEKSKFTPPPSDFNVPPPDEDDDIPLNTNDIIDTTAKTETKKTEPIKDESDGKLEEYLTEENGGISVDEFLDED